MYEYVWTHVCPYGKMLALEFCIQNAFVSVQKRIWLTEWRGMKGGGCLTCQHFILLFKWFIDVKHNGVFFFFYTFLRQYYLWYFFFMGFFFVIWFQFNICWGFTTSFWFLCFVAFGKYLLDCKFAGQNTCLYVCS